MTSRFGSYSKPLLSAMRTAASIAALTLAAASCTSDSTSTEPDEEPTATTDAPADTTAPTDPSTTEAPATAPDESPTSVPETPRSRVVQIVDESLLGPANEAWSLQEESFFVYGVDPADSLNVRSGPGVDKPVVATIAPNSGTLRIYDSYENVGSTSWVPVQITDDGRVGWVSGQFLKPEPPAGSPIINGAASEEVLALVDQVLASLADPAALSELVGTEGLAISPFAYIGDETLTLTKDEVATTGDTERTWGTETGSGDPIVATLADYLSGLERRSALTSTVEIGYGEVVGGGNSINNLDEVFPGATVVEYNHPGTSFFGGLDWTSVRFVFTEDDGNLVLRALVSDQWEI